MVVKGKIFTLAITFMHCKLPLAFQLLRDVEDLTVFTKRLRSSGGRRLNHLWQSRKKHMGPKHRSQHRCRPEITPEG